MAAGYDTWWSRRKLDRARTHLADLERASASWLDPATHGLDVVIADEGRRLDLVLAIDEPAPLDEWSLIAGDCVHNIRTALDVFIWANSNGLTEPQLRRVAYPILPYEDELGDPDSSDRLEDQSTRTRRGIERKIAGLPEPLRERTLDNIRWASLPDGDYVIRHQRLPILDELDNVDKHRLSLDLAASTSSLTSTITAMNANGRQVRLDLAPGPDVGMPLTLGTRVVMGVGSPYEGPIIRTQGAATVSLNLRVRLLDRALDLRPWLADLIDDASGLLDVLGAPATAS